MPQTHEIAFASFAPLRDIHRFPPLAQVGKFQFPAEGAKDAKTILACLRDVVHDRSRGFQPDFLLRYHFAANLQFMQEKMNVH